ncbi:MAG: hypothetical protein KDA85_15865, partial [Planctomycetaceae bacterium]|nr:hypothetical protein [Planctomycetaceae bacterium]
MSPDPDSIDSFKRAMKQVGSNCRTSPLFTLVESPAGALTRPVRQLPGCWRVVGVNPPAHS